ncbi:hypothetical protein AKO1_003327 [Acrasis kona]|uniref:BTB domain-containing protein n=1 Tax=Acrasis kona TaxID=1008807 RepID=A0AAW2ZAF7_9EUKA
MCTLTMYEYNPSDASWTNWEVPKTEGYEIVLDREFNCTSRDNLFVMIEYHRTYIYTLDVYKKTWQLTTPLRKLRSTFVDSFHLITPTVLIIAESQDTVDSIHLPSGFVFKHSYNLPFSFGLFSHNNKLLILNNYSNEVVEVDLSRVLNLHSILDQSNKFQNKFQEHYNALPTCQDDLYDFVLSCAFQRTFCSDMIVKYLDTDYPCHGQVLSATSRFFCNMFDEDCNDDQDDHVKKTCVDLSLFDQNIKSKTSLEIALSYMYGGVLEISKIDKHGLVDLAITADFLGLDELFYRIYHSFDVRMTDGTIDALFVFDFIFNYFMEHPILSDLKLNCITEIFKNNLYFIEIINKYDFDGVKYTIDMANEHSLLTMLTHWQKIKEGCSCDAGKLEEILNYIIDDLSENFITSLNELIDVLHVLDHAGIDLNVIPDKIYDIISCQTVDTPELIKRIDHINSNRIILKSSIIQKLKSKYQNTLISILSNVPNGIKYSDVILSHPLESDLYKNVLVDQIMELLLVLKEVHLDDLVKKWFKIMTSIVRSSIYDCREFLIFYTKHFFDDENVSFDLNYDYSGRYYVSILCDKVTSEEVISMLDGAQIARIFTYQKENDVPCNPENFEITMNECFRFVLSSIASITDFCRLYRVFEEKKYWLEKFMAHLDKVVDRNYTSVRSALVVYYEISSLRKSIFDIHQSFVSLEKDTVDYISSNPKSLQDLVLKSLRSSDVFVHYLHEE